MSETDQLHDATQSDAQSDTQSAPQGEAPETVPVATDSVIIYTSGAETVRSATIADLFEAAHAALTASLPDGSHHEFRDGMWHVYRGAGTTSHGAGKTLARAILAINATRGIDQKTGRPCEYTEGGDLLPPE